MTGFRKTFNEIPALLPSNEDLDLLLGNIEDEDRRKELMEMAIELAQARVDLDPEDIKLLKTIALVMQD